MYTLKVSGQLSYMRGSKATAIQVLQQEAVVGGHCWDWQHPATCTEVQSVITSS